MSRVSVIIPAYNASRFLKAAIDSVLAQTYADIEVIVIDDGSTDDTAQIASNSPGVICIRKPNGGVSSARNAGVRSSTGDYVAFLDADDVWHPQKIACQVALMEQHADCDLSYTRMSVDSETDSVTSTTVDAGQMRHTRIDELGPSFRNPFFGTSSVIVRRAAFDRAGGFDETLPFAEDINFFLRVVIDRPLVFILEFVSVYKRPVVGSLSQDSSAGYAKLIGVYDVLLRERPELATRHPQLVATTLAEMHMRHARSLLRAGRRVATIGAVVRSLRAAPTRSAWRVLASACAPRGALRAVRAMRGRPAG
jgi:hypothetical protein